MIVIDIPQEDRRKTELDLAKHLNETYDVDVSVYTDVYAIEGSVVWSSDG